MGIQLETYFEKAKTMGGITAQVKLAMKTKMTSMDAKDTEDTPENIQIFEKAINDLTAELQIKNI